MPWIIDIYCPRLLIPKSFQTNNYECKELQGLNHSWIQPGSGHLSPVFMMLAISGDHCLHPQRYSRYTAINFSPLCKSTVEFLHLHKFNSPSSTAVSEKIASLVLNRMQLDKDSWWAESHWIQLLHSRHLPSFSCPSSESPSLMGGDIHAYIYIFTGDSCCCMAEINTL